MTRSKTGKNNVHTHIQKIINHDFMDLKDLYINAKKDKSVEPVEKLS